MAPRSKEVKNRQEDGGELISLLSRSTCSCPSRFHRHRLSRCDSTGTAGSNEKTTTTTTTTTKKKKKKRKRKKKKVYKIFKSTETSPIARGDKFPLTFYFRFVRNARQRRVTRAGDTGMERGRGPEKRRETESETP